MDFETPDGSNFSLIPIYKEDANGEPTFHYTSVTAVVNGEAFAGRLEQPPEVVDDADAMQCLQLVPPENIYPELQSRYTLAPPFESDRHYLKSPSFTYDDSAPGNTFVADCLRNEINVLEKLRETPHLNLSTYLGCVANNGRVIQISFKRYRCNLLEYLNQLADQGTLSSETCARLSNDIRDGIKHLHNNMGMAHNDINEHNICVDEDGRAIVVDFDSCLPFGEPLVKGVSGEEMPVSHAENDWRGMDGIDDLLNEISIEVKREEEHTDD